AGWVRRNADEVSRLLFPSGPEGAAQGVPGGIQLALDAFDVLVLPDIPPVGQGRLHLDLPSRNQTLTLLEVERFRVDGISGTSYKLTPGHDMRFDRLEIGFSVPLRYARLEDSNDTQSFFGGLNVHAKYHYYLYPEWQVIPLVGSAARVFTMHSDQSSTFGNILYGGQVGVATTIELERAVV